METPIAFINRSKDKEEVVFIHTREYSFKKKEALKKEGILAICDNVDGPEDITYDKWSKSGRER